jgi:biotin carboxylase
MANTKVCVIVDPYKNAKDYPAYCKTQGYDCVYVQSTPTAPPALQAMNTYRPEDYLEKIIYDGNFQHLTEQLAQYNIIAVIPGGEIGVELADQLAVHFKTPNNGLVKSAARRDKYLMHEALKAAGVASVPHFKSNDCQAIVDWAKQNNSWPIVVKPLRSGGTSDVYVCQTPEKLLQYCETIRSHQNIFHEENTEVLAQNFLRGIEYVVDTVSCNGQHYVISIWEYRKRLVKELDSIIYDRVNLLPSQGALQTQLVDYILQVLKALDIQNGPGHAEIMLTENGPILVEIGARLGGHLDVVACQRCFGYSHIELTVDSYTNPALFKQKTQAPYVLKEYCNILYLISSQEGIVESVPILDLIKSLPSYFFVAMSAQPGKPIQKTRDLLTIPGMAILLHPDAAVVDRDYETIIQAEPTGYIVKNG